MGSGPGKPVGDVTRPLATNRSATPDTSRSPSPRRADTMPKALTPPSSANISAHAPGERDAGAAAVFPEIHAAARQEGQPLAADTRSRVGTGLGTDFGDVRIHTGERAARAADALQARAYTIGNDIVFGAGEYAPGSASGQHLLAHELAHVAQPDAHRSQDVSRENDASEREADHAADAVMRGESVRLQAAPTATVQREPKPDAEQKLKPDAGHKPMLSLMDRMFDDASPFLAASIGSTTIANFDTGKADLKPAHLIELKKNAHSIALLLKQYPQSSVHVIGHTDTVGTEENTLTLGQARADATAAALGKLGVPSTILDATSAGEASPQAVKTKDEPPSAQNRRGRRTFRAEGGHRDQPAAQARTRCAEEGSGPDRDAHATADRSQLQTGQRFGLQGAAVSTARRLESGVVQAGPAPDQGYRVEIGDRSDRREVHRSGRRSRRREVVRRTSATRSSRPGGTPWRRAPRRLRDSPRRMPASPTRRRSMPSRRRPSPRSSRRAARSHDPAQRIGPDVGAQSASAVKGPASAAKQATPDNAHAADRANRQPQRRRDAGAATSPLLFSAVPAILPGEGGAPPRWSLRTAALPAFVSHPSMRLARAPHDARSGIGRDGIGRDGA